MAEPRIAIAYDCLFPHDAGGGERVYRRLAESFAERGSDVTYVTRSGRADDDAPFTVDGVWSGAIADADGRRRPAAALGFAAALFRYFVRRRRRHDLVVVAALPVLNVFAVRLALVGTPTVIVADWLEVWPARTWHRYSGPVVGSVAFVLQWLGTHIGRIQTVNSAFTAARLRAYRRGADPIVLGLVDLAGEPRTSSFDPVAPLFVLFVGRHIDDKRVDAIPGALEFARSAVPELRAVVAGVGPTTDLARRAAAEAGVADVTEFVGRIDDRRLDRLMAEAAALVLPSRREGFGLVVAEAASYGTPAVVVAGEDNAAAELVVEGVNGAVSPSASPAELGAAIERAVMGGLDLRASTSDWFERERRERSLERSVDLILRRWRALRRG